MSPAERLIAEQQARLRAIETNGASAIASRYRSVLTDLRERSRSLTARIAAARASGEEVSVSWLRREERYALLIGELEVRVTSWLRTTIEQIEQSKGQAIAQGMRDVPRLTTTAMGPAPPAAVAAVEGAFDRLPTAQIDRMVRNAGDGRPLGRLLARIAPEGVDRVRSALESGVARGAGTRVIAAEVARAGGLPLSRALTISRTEILRAYRDTAGEMWGESEVVRGWQWVASLDDRCCLSCWASHGTHVEDPSEVYGLHVNCRCTAAPRTASWEELGFEGVPDGRQEIVPGPERFDRLTESEQLQVLGPSRMGLYQQGTPLGSMVTDVRDPEWGPGRRILSLEEVGA